jgi:hypothetical protein
MGNEELPTYEECRTAVDNGTATELQAFIYNHEPANQTDMFREGLRALIAEARSTTSAVVGEAAVASGEKRCLRCLELYAPSEEYDDSICSVCASAKIVNPRECTVLSLSGDKKLKQAEHLYDNEDRCVYCNKSRADNWIDSAADQIWKLNDDMKYEKKHSREEIADIVWASLKAAATPSPSSQSAAELPKLQVGSGLGMFCEKCERDCLMRVARTSLTCLSCETIYPFDLDDYLRPSPRSAAEICAEMAREAERWSQAHSNPTSIQSCKAQAIVLREAQRRIEAATPTVPDQAARRAAGMPPLLDPLEFWADLAEVLGHERPVKADIPALVSEVKDRLAATPTETDAVFDEVSRRMDAVVEAAVAWRNNDDVWNDDLERAVDSLLELRAPPEPQK